MKDVDISSGARKNDVNARIVFARNSSFCQAHAFEVLTIYHLYVLLSKFHTKQDFVFKYVSCNFIYNSNGIFKLWEFDLSHPFAGNKQSAYIVNFPAERTRWQHSAGPTMIYGHNV